MAVMRELAAAFPASDNSARSCHAWHRLSLIILVSLSVSALASDRAVSLSWRSPAEFQHRLVKFHTSQSKDYFAGIDWDSPAEAKLGRIIFPEKIDSLAVSWPGENVALVFATARPQLESTPAAVGVVFVLCGGSTAGWHVVDARHFEAVGNVSQIGCKLTAEAGTGSAALADDNRGVVATVERQTGGGGYAYTTCRSCRLEHRPGDSAPHLEEFF